MRALYMTRTPPLKPGRHSTLWSIIMRSGTSKILQDSFVSDDLPCFDALRARHVEQAARSLSFALLEQPEQEAKSVNVG